MMNAKMQKLVLFFDVNETLLDLKEVRNSVANALNGNEEIASLWFETLLHYSLVSTAVDEYQNFGDIGAAALVMLAENRGIELHMEAAHEILISIRSAPAHPEVPEALEHLKSKGYRMAALTNSPREGMETQLKNAGIGNYFEQQLSVEDIGLYKPHLHVYRWAARQMNVHPESCLFIAAHGWDVAGAMSAGMKAAFLNRPGQHLYPLSAKPVFIEPDLKCLSSKL
jgi:2-haloacid dehalogenase